MCTGRVASAAGEIGFCTCSWRLLMLRSSVHVRAMIAVKAEKDRLEISRPTEGMSPEEVSDLVSWWRAESIARRSKPTPEAGWMLSEEIKSDWWQTDAPRFRSQGE